MAFLKKSLSEDSIDRYSHTWTFLFLLLLSIIFLFVTLSPSMTLTQPKSSFKPDGTSTQGKTSIEMGVADPRYNADCWASAHFSSSASTYTNSICASALNSLVQGQNFSGAVLYKILKSPMARGDSGVLRIEDFLPIQAYENDNKSESSEAKGHEELQTKTEFLRHEKEKLQSDIQDLASYKVPLYLFLLAICLRLPHAVWSILSTCCSSFNVDQTLATANTSKTMDTESQQRIKENIDLTVGTSSRKCTALLYLLMKMLMVVVTCVEVYVVANCLLKDIDKLEDDVATVKINVEDVKRLLRSAQSIDSSNTEELPSQTRNLPDMEVYLCDFDMRQLQMMHRYTVQCLFTKMEASLSINGKSPSENEKPMMIQPSGVMTESEILLLYKALFTIVLATLVILAFCNITSLIVWLLKLLLTSSRQCLGLKKDASLDVVFLVSMARCNTSAVVATDLAKSSVWSDSSSCHDQERLRD